jgi:tetratricopeptide (TPR) repeat protein
MDAGLQSMYADTIKLIDSYAELLIDLGVLDREYQRKASEQSTADTTDSATKGFSLGGAMAAAGVEPGTAFVIGTGMLIKEGFASYQKGQRLADERAVALERRQNQYIAEYSRGLGRIRVQADVLSEKHGWGKGEVGFDQDEAETQQVLKAWEQADLGFLQSRASHLKEVRPRDPFVYCANGLLAALRSELWRDDDARAAVASDEAVKDYLRAAELIPNGAFHDDLRAVLLEQAGWSAAMASYHKQQRSSRGLEIVQAALDLQPRDPSGALRYAKAVTLARAGKHEEAVATLEGIVPLVRDAPELPYVYACLLSQAGRYDDALAALEEAVKNASEDIRWMRRDRDLDGLRYNRCVAFEMLVKPRWEWTISYGFVWNDTILQNQSAFPLTRVLLTTEWISREGKKSTETYWADSVPVGGSVTWKGTFDEASQSQADAKKCTSMLSCEESRAVRPIALEALHGTYRGLATLHAIDGKDCKATDAVELEVTADGKKAILKIRTGTNTAEFALEPLYDGATSATREANGGHETVSLFVQGDTLYGWYQNARDATAGAIRAFWAEKQASR